MKLKYTKMASLAATLITYGSLVGGANAAVVIFTPSSGNTVSQSTTLYWDPVSAFISTSSLGAIGGFNLTDHGDFHFTVSDADMVNIGSGTGGQTIPVGQLVGPSSNFTNTSDFVGTTDFSGTMSLGDRAFFGLSFQLSGQTHYGWVEISEDATTQTIHRWAYETTPNTAIEVTAVPEPSSAILLGLGTLGISVLRRRKR
jgi:hypothetical protein